MSVSDRCTLDTNVLFYSLDSEGGDKYVVAKNLIARANRENTLIVLQTLGELFQAIQRKQPQRLYSARNFIEDSLELFDVISADRSDLPRALVLQERHNIQFWDALIVVTAQRAGCPILLSEDFQDGQVFGTITVRNPFAMSPEELAALFF
jgi:predicted nucleic acid-binding protein